VSRPITRTDRDRVAVLTLDCPGRVMNVVDEQVLADLADHVEQITGDDGVDAFVLASGKDRAFGAGADVSWLPELAAREDADDFLAGVHELMLRIARGDTPMVTAIHGTAFGGALELALAGHGIVATGDASVGLPEVGLQLLPGGGGTQLLLRWVPLERALAMLTSGRPVTAADAHEDGLVTRLAEPGDLLDSAVALARDLVDGSRMPATPSLADDAVATVEATRENLAGSRRGLSTAAATILDVVRVGAAEGQDAGLAAERAAFLRLLRSAEARAAIHLFQVEADVKRRSRGDDLPAVSALGVVGGGQMGSGIAATAVSRGLDAVVRDLSEEALDRARAYRDKALDRIGRGSGDPRADHWHGTTGWDRFDRVDAVVEAVFELPELKTDILGQLGDVVDDETLLATNTSAISISRLAEAVTGPDRFIGMHFFSPVDRMPLVELIPHAGTSATTQQRAAALGRQLGKVPVVVGDAPGFFTSRVYARWLMEGVRLLLDGVPVDRVDAAAKSVGFPVGPLQAHDEATLELVVQASITQVAENVMADRLDVGGVRGALERLIEAGVVGRRHGRGFYAYDDGRRAGPAPEVAEVLGEPATTSITQDVAADRLLLAFVTECLLCWDDGTLCHPDDGDVASVLGIGFPRALGGPFHWVDESGHEQVRKRCEALGDAFPTGTSLGAGAFADAPRRPAPFQPAGATR
jgi:3-hydroxyacyl-CoA dehydrogenase/enoyl-CoA hydratase/3-hydroxybutyryl-CoA epimerase